MIYSRFIFPLKQRIFWRNVQKRREEWSGKSRSMKEIRFSVTPSLHISLNCDDELSGHIYSNAFEWEEREWLKSVVQPGDVFYDVGANIGYFSLLASEWCGENGKVISFEPVSKTFSRLKRNIGENPRVKNIHAFQLAASDQEGEHEIYISESGRDAWNSIATKPGANDFALSEKIVAAPIDLLREKEQLPCPTIMKIDVEGWELHVLKGAVQTLKTCRPKMLVEFTKENLLASGASCTMLAELIRSLDYELFAYDARQRKLVPVTDFSFVHRNLMAIPR